MAFCEQCGNKISDDAKFCRNCGAKVVANDIGRSTDNGVKKVAVVYKPQYERPVLNDETSEQGAAVKQLTKGKIVLIFIIAAVVFAGSITAIKLKTSYNCSKPFSAIEEGFEDNDFERILEAFPEKYKDELKNSVGTGEYRDGIREINDGMKELKDELDEETDWGDDIKISHKILNTERLSDKQIKNIMRYNKKAGLGFEIESAYNTDVRFTAQSSNGFIGYFTYNFTVGKVDGNWVIVDFNSILSDLSEYDIIGEEIDMMAEDIYDELNYEYDDDYDYDDYYDDYDY